MSHQISHEHMIERPYDLFVSYAHQDSRKVRPIIGALIDIGIRVFDPFANQQEMWGRNLGTWFSEAFPARAKAAMIFLSENYGKSIWCNKELEYVLKTAQDNPALARILPIRLDDSRIPDQAADVVFLELAENSPKEIAELTKAKLETFEDSSSTELAVLPDEELVEKIAAERDHEAFNVLYKRVYPRILRYIRWYLTAREVEHETDLSIDIVGDVLVKLWEQASRFSRQDSSFDSWVAGLTTQSILERDVKHKRYRSQEVLVPSLPESVELTSQKFSPWYFHNAPGIDQSADAAILLSELLEGLNKEERQLIELFANGTSSKEIAEILGLSQPLVRVRLFRLVSKLRSKVADAERA